VSRADGLRTEWDWAHSGRPRHGFRGVGAAARGAVRPEDVKRPRTGTARPLLVLELRTLLAVLVVGWTPNGRKRTSAYGDRSRRVGLRYVEREVVVGNQGVLPLVGRLQRNPYLKQQRRADRWCEGARGLGPSPRARASVRRAGRAPLVQ
jgi:hypothetical protein